MLSTTYYARNYAGITGLGLHRGKAINIVILRNFQISEVWRGLYAGIVIRSRTYVSFSFYML